MLIYNSNGREIGSVDSQPTKFAARELAARHTLRLDRVIAERPGLADRPAFAQDTEGHWRSAYSPVPAILGALPALVLSSVGIIDLDAPLAPNLIAVLTASLLTAGAVTLVFLSLSRIASVTIALVTTLGLAVGTNYWPLVSRTLWGHETVAAGFSLALWAWLRPQARHVHLVLGGLGLAVAAAARPEVSPTAVIMILWLTVRYGLRSIAIPATIILATGALVIVTNMHWFGAALGATPRLEAAHYGIHRVRGTISTRPWMGVAGLLISPSRGILVFSPILLIPLLGLRDVRRVAPSLRLQWLALASLAQFVTYAGYTVWWAGHTYGPRYLLDALVPLMPCAAIGTATLARSSLGRVAGVMLLAWSTIVAAAGAFIYPSGLWNIDPLDVDRRHERLWEITDSQIPRTFRSPLSPQNFELFSVGAVRR